MCSIKKEQLESSKLQERLDQYLIKSLHKKLRVLESIDL